MLRCFNQQHNACVHTSKVPSSDALLFCMPLGMNPLLELSGPGMNTRTFVSAEIFLITARLPLPMRKACFVLWRENSATTSSTSSAIFSMAEYAYTVGKHSEIRKNLIDRKVVLPSSLQWALRSL